MTEITFYHSKICPRCVAARKLLKELETEFPHLKIKRIGAISHLVKREIYTLPAIRIGDTILYGKEITREKLLQQIQ